MAKHDIIKKMEEELTTAKADSQHFLDALMGEKTKQADTMDQIMFM